MIRFDLREIHDRFRGWLGLSDAQRVNLDRRAFARGLMLTSAGLLLPASSIVDFGRAEEEAWPIALTHGRNRIVLHNWAMAHDGPQGSALAVEIAAKWSQRLKRAIEDAEKATEVAVSISYRITPSSSRSRELWTGLPCTVRCPRDLPFR